MRELLDGADRGPVHDLEEGEVMRRVHRDDRLPSALKRVEEGEESRRGTRRPEQAHGRLHDDAQRPLGADKEPREVEPGHVLRGEGARAEKRSVGRHEFQRGHMVSRDAVLETARATRVRRDVAADGRYVAAGRIGCIE